MYLHIYVTSIIGCLLSGCLTCAQADLKPDEYKHYCHIAESMKAAKVKFAMEIDSGKLTSATIDKVRTYVYHQIADSLFPYWLDTPWDFNGTTKVPGSGTIACGYLVTTLLQHGGFHINRYRIAQLSAEKIVISVCPQSSIHRYCDMPLDRFCNTMSQLGDGLYVVGLDYHVGFIFVKEKEVFFLHSTYVYPGCVIKEKASESIVLESTRYRIVGKLLGTREFVRQWIEGR
jgi:hypothetical protein